MFQVNDAIAFEWGYSTATGRVLSVDEDGSHAAVLMDNYKDWIVQIGLNRHYKPIRIGCYVPHEVHTGWGPWKKTEIKWERVLTANKELDQACEGANREH